MVHAASPSPSPPNWHAYYAVHEALTATEVRRIWLAEGKRRGYVLEDA